MAELRGYPGAPRWVKVSAIVAAVLALLAVILIVAGGTHGPGLHTVGNGGPPAEGAERTPASGNPALHEGHQ